MKGYLVVAGLIAFGVVSAQNNPASKKPNQSMVFIVPKGKSPKPTTSKPLIELSQLSHKLPNGSTVNLLPQDNMPCVVPDMSQSNMPVVKPSIKPYTYTIPNPLYPPSNKPTIVTEEQWKKFLELQKNNNR
jgi:hypothetical protein